MTCTLEGTSLTCSGTIRGKLHPSKRLKWLADAAVWDEVGR